MLLSKLTRILLLAICFGSLNNIVLAQRPTADAAAQFLRRMDANRDGVLSPNEIPSRSRAAVERLAKAAGLDLARPLSIDRLERQIRSEEGDGDDRRGRDEDRRDEDRRRDDRRDDDRRRDDRRGRDERGRDDRRDDRRRDDRRDRDRDEQPAATTGRGFGQSSSDSSGGSSRSFGGSSSGGGAAMSDSKLEERYDERIISYVERFLRQYDKNGNGRLDNAEWKDVRWGSDPNESDLNKDGNLSKAELCARMEKRWGNRRSGDRDRGDRDRDSNRGGGDSRDSSDQIKRYADGLLKRYDKSGNGVLEKEEWSQMRSRYASADANKDSVITSAELRIFLSKGSDDSNSSSRSREDSRSRDSGGRDRYARRSDSDSQSRKSYRFLTPTERLEGSMSGRIREEFIKLDANADGQIAMAEFSKTWNDEKVEEFTKLDANRDGIVTPTEFIASKSGGSSEESRGDSRRWGRR